MCVMTHLLVHDLNALDIPCGPLVNKGFVSCKLRLLAKISFESSKRYVHRHSHTNIEILTKIVVVYD
ncbi:unnamed protein product [Arabidopsis halleri]